MIFYDLAALCRELGQAESELGSVEWAGEFDAPDARAGRRANHLRWAEDHLRHAAAPAASLRPLVSADRAIEREVGAYDAAVAKLAALRLQYPDAAGVERVRAEEHEARRRAAKAVSA